MHAIRKRFAAAFSAAALATSVRAQVPVLTRSYDTGRTGANVRESTLTPAKVTAGLVKKKPLVLVGDDPKLEAQPLHVPGVVIGGQARNIVYVATMSNNLWAFDVDTGDVIWKMNAAPTGRLPIKPGPDPQRPPPASAIDMWGTNTLWGILSTPVIDLESKLLYVVTWSSDDGTIGKALHHLHAFDIVSGARVKGPLVIEAQTGNPNDPERFTSPGQKQRSALLLTTYAAHDGSTKKVLIMASGMHGENTKGLHGWVFAFDPDTFQKTAAWCSTPAGRAGGIWQSGQGPASDGAGRVYFMTSNGNWDNLPADKKTDFAESFMKLRYVSPTAGDVGRLIVDDWFTPFRDDDREPEFRDNDLGSGGAVLPPGTSLLLGGGKDGVLYIFDRNNLGKKLGRAPADFAHLKMRPFFFTYYPGTTTTGQEKDATDLKNLDVEGKTHHQHGSPVYWKAADKARLFNWGENECLRCWEVDPATGKATFVGKSAEVAARALALAPTGMGGMPGGMLTLSSNGDAADSGVVWALAPIDRDANREPLVEGILRAYHATKLDPNLNADGTQRLLLLWDSKRIPGNTFNHAKFNLPVVADGKVIVPTADGRVDVYGPP